VADVHGGAATEAVAMARYQRARDALSARLYAAVETIATYSWTMPRLRRLLLEASSAMTEQLEVMRRVDRHASAPAVTP
jgi:hypothetical protein